MSDRRDYYTYDIVELLDGPQKVLTEADFEGYQIWMSDMMVEHDAVIIGAFMGSGKTAAALRAIVKMKRLKKYRKYLIVAPVHVAKDTWPDEMLVWDFAHELTWSVLVGTPEEREAARKEHTEVHIVNRENFRWLRRAWGRHWPYDVLFYDEASRLKAGNKKTKAVERADGSFSEPRLSEFGQLCLVRNFFKKVIELSGTLTPNGLIDFWGPMYIIDRGFRLGKSKTAFENRWFSYNAYTRKHKAHDHSFDEITKLVSDCYFTLREEDHVKMPPLIVRDRLVTLPERVMRMYREFEEHLCLEEFDIEAVNRGVLTNKLLQFANGSLYKDDEEAIKIHDCKLDMLESVFEEAGGEPVLIGYSYKFDIAAIKKRFPFVKLFGEGKNDKRDWNSGKFKGMLLHPWSAGHGMNFQYGGNIAVWYDSTPA